MPGKQPNTICKNINCKKGKDGGRKNFYSCRYCLNQAVWSTVACCPECHAAYMQQVEEARSKTEPVDLFPERTDMSRKKVKKIVKEEPVEVAIAITKEELKDEMAENPDASIAEIVRKINKEIDEGGGE